MSNIIRFIGDVHGKYRPYRELIRGVPRSIQVGDMGVGFLKWPHGTPSLNPPYDAMREGDHRFIRGNHDNPGACKRHTQYIPDGTVENDMMFIGGAVSIDKAYRIEGYSYWSDEELSLAELNQMVDIYATVRPRIMVTHECPEEVSKVLCERAGWAKFEIGSRTRQAFQSMFETHKPELWIHGHWHLSMDHVVDGTRFICLAELEYKDIDVEGKLDE